MPCKHGFSDERWCHYCLGGDVTDTRTPGQVVYFVHENSFFNAKISTQSGIINEVSWDRAVNGGRSEVHRKWRP